MVGLFFYSGLKVIGAGFEKRSYDDEMIRAIMYE